MPNIPSNPSGFKNSVKNRFGSKWRSTLRVERRNGRTGYVVTFSNGGDVSVTLHGVFPLAVSDEAVQAEGLEAIANWMAHVEPNNEAPSAELKRIRHIGNQTSRSKKQHWKHGLGRRAA